MKVLQGLEDSLLTAYSFCVQSKLVYLYIKRVRECDGFFSSMCILLIKAGWYGYGREAGTPDEPLDLLKQLTPLHASYYIGPHRALLSYMQNT